MSDDTWDANEWRERLRAKFADARDKPPEPEKDRDPDIPVLEPFGTMPTPDGDMAADAAGIMADTYGNAVDRNFGPPAAPEIGQDQEESADSTKDQETTSPDNDPFRSHTAPVTEENYPPLAKEFDHEPDNDRT